MHEKPPHLAGLDADVHHRGHRIRHSTRRELVVRAQAGRGRQPAAVHRGTDAETARPIEHAPPGLLIRIRERLCGGVQLEQLLPLLCEGSNIVAISSVTARTVAGNPNLENPSILAYASTKGALETLVKNWAAILGPRGIRVNAVAPGVIDTDMSNFTKTEAGREVTLGMQALKRIGKPEDVADVVSFLASDKARWITGASIPVDGGSKL